MSRGKRVQASFLPDFSLPVGLVSFTAELELLIRARYPLVYVLTGEELRAEEAVLEVAGRRNKKVFAWTCTGGLVPAGTSIQSKHRNMATRDPLIALDQILEQVEPAVFVFKDLHAWMGPAYPAVVRKLKDIALHLKNSLKTILLVSPVLMIPIELEKEITVLSLPLPDRAELGALLDEIAEEMENQGSVRVDVDAAGRDRLMEAARGLTRAETENVFARVLVKHGRLGGDLVSEVFAEKQQLVRKNGLLEYLVPAEGFDHVGGLAGLKKWLRERRLAFTLEAREFGLPSPRGVLLLGVQGCGKSLCAKAVASEWQLPLLRFDLGRLFGSYVGSSEENVRRAIAVAESVSPAVLWIDEIDKAFAGTASSGASDGGTGARVFGTLLTWLAEKTAPVFVVATANDISHLPPELLRRGRFDEIFFVDLPDDAGRAEILRVHLNRRGRSAEFFDVGAVVAATPDFSGAEIEAVVVAGLYSAFAAGHDLTSDDLLRAGHEMIPLARTMAEQTNRLREWATVRARRA